MNVQVLLLGIGLGLAMGGLVAWLASRGKVARLEERSARVEVLEREVTELRVLKEERVKLVTRLEDERLSTQEKLDCIRLTLRRRPASEQPVVPGAGAH